MSGLTGDWGKINNILDPVKLRKSIRQCAAKVGNYGVSEVKKGIQSGAPAGQKFEPLQALTVWTKGSSKPLINHGDLLGSVNYQVFNDNDSVFIGVKKGVKRSDGEDAVQIAAVHEFGCTIAVTPKMRAYLHYQGIHLKAETTHIHIPPRPFLRPIFQSPDFQNMVSQIYVSALREVFMT